MAYEVDLQRCEAMLADGIVISYGWAVSSIIRDFTRITQKLAQCRGIDGRM